MNRVLKRIDPLVTTKWLASRILGKSHAPGPVATGASVRVLDGTASPEAEDLFDQTHIPGAQFFDIDDCSDKKSDYPRMIPKPRLFEDYIGELGINNKTHVIVYDMSPAGMFSAPRVWWMLRYFGHESVSVLNGGLPKWLEDGLEVTNEHHPVQPQIFKAQPNPRLLKVYEDIEMLAKENCHSLPIVDVRPPAVFASHIRGATNVPLGLFSDPDKHQVTSPKELEKRFSQNGIDVHQPFISSCNSGTTACAGALAAFICGNEDVAVYDGSWQEWVRRAPPELTEHSPTEE